MSLIYDHRGPKRQRSNRDGLRAVRQQLVARISRPRGRRDRAALGPHLHQPRLVIYARSLELGKRTIGVWNEHAVRTATEMSKSPSSTRSRLTATPANVALAQASSRSVTSTTHERAELAATRDASWFNHPDVYSLKKYHIAIESGRSRRTGSPLYDAACNSESRPLFELSACPAAGVPRGLRCQSNGCKQRWP